MYKTKESLTCLCTLLLLLLFLIVLQCEGKQYNSKSDIWSLGCILHEMMCLSRPFDGTNLPALVHKIVEVHTLNLCMFVCMCNCCDYCMFIVHMQGSFDPIKGKYSDELKQLVSREGKEIKEEREKRERGREGEREGGRDRKERIDNCLNFLLYIVLGSEDVTEGS